MLDGSALIGRHAINDRGKQMRIPSFDPYEELKRRLDTQLPGIAYFAVDNAGKTIALSNATIDLLGPCCDLVTDLVALIRELTPPKDRGKGRRKVRRLLCGRLDDQTEYFKHIRMADGITALQQFCVRVYRDASGAFEYAVIVILPTTDRAPVTPIAAETIDRMADRVGMFAAVVGAGIRQPVVSVRLPDELLAELRRVAAKEGVSVDDVIRRIVRAETGRSVEAPRRRPPRGVVASKPPKRLLL
jgi:hypothetical protein